MKVSRLPRLFLWTALAASFASAARAETVRWRNTFDFYSDDVESFTPYRIDGTFLTGQYKSWLDVQPATGTHFLAGFFMQHLSGSRDFADTVLPVLSWRYQTETDQFIMGTLETHDRHGLIEPLAVTQLDFLRPMEYGLQWLSKRDSFNADLFVNWSQVLVIGSQREQFHYGGVLSQRLAGPLSIEYQAASFHQGGELAGVGIVANNFVGAWGLRLHGGLGRLGESELAVYRVWDHDGFHGHGINGRSFFVRGSLAPWRGTQLLGIFWNGHDFISADGDPNYFSIGYDNAIGGLAGYYKSNRDVEELGIRKTIPLNDFSSFEAEERNQMVDAYFVWWFRLVGRIRFDRLLW